MYFFKSSLQVSVSSRVLAVNKWRDDKILVLYIKFEAKSKSGLGFLGVPLLPDAKVGVTPCDTFDLQPLPCVKTEKGLLLKCSLYTKAHCVAP